MIKYSCKLLIQSYCPIALSQSLLFSTAAVIGTSLPHKNALTGRISVSARI